ncbi:hypothetical protein D4V05_26070 [Escherichia coli]|nr:hypothetical protein [Escherichia coli]KDV12317.1 hypothetical protein BW72_05940 [Escherichia coli O78:H12 str. 00-3279]EEW3501533.1 hypothetical protein [Escherichia coli]EEW4281667.1 hypothetical protein [Escherichia coli]EGD8531393.1 hypothetical protein [Escherichia coli]
MTDFGRKTSIFSHPICLFLRKFSLQNFRGGSRPVPWERRGKFPCAPAPSIVCSLYVVYWH